MFFSAVTLGKARGAQSKDLSSYYVLPSVAEREASVYFVERSFDCGLRPALRMTGIFPAAS